MAWVPTEVAGRRRASAPAGWAAAQRRRAAEAEAGVPAAEAGGVPAAEAGVLVWTDAAMPGSEGRCNLGCPPW